MIAESNGVAHEVGAHRELSPAHLKELAASGISKEFAERAGLHSESDSKKLAAHLNRKGWPTKWGDALAFPVSDLDGRYLFTRVKPKWPPIGTNGKPQKYMQPSKVGTRPYFPPGVPQQLASYPTQVIITEGDKKALCGAERGFCCVGLPGVWNWKPGGKVGKLMADLERIEWSGVTVFIAFDSDAIEKQQVKSAEQVLAAELRSRGAVVKCVRFPAADDGSKQGLDDFIVSKGDQWAEAFTTLLKEAVDAEAIDPGSIIDAASEMDPATEANGIVKAMTDDGVSTLRFWNGEYWYYRHGCYSRRRDDEVRAELVNRLNQRYAGVRPKHATDVLEHLRAKTILSSATNPPAWLATDGTDPPPAECVVMRNGLLHLPSLFKGEKCLTPATPRLLTTTAVDYEFDAQAPEPVEWFKFLASVWGDDRESIECLQDWFGYSLVNDTSHQKIGLLIGPTRSGKGVIARMQRRLVGVANVCGPTLASLAQQFGLQPLIGKSVGQISDARLGHRTDQSIVLERLLSISGEDTLNIPQKFKEDITTKLPTRLTIFSNELPRFADASSAITGRFLVMRMHNSFLGREDRTLEAKLTAELPSIFLWACKGWYRLNERGYFRQPGSGLELLAELRDLASPVSAFVRERCEVGVGHLVPIADLYGEWTSWCHVNGRDHAGTVQTFGRDLLAAASGVSAKQRRIHGNVVRVYEGIRLAISENSN